MKIQGLLDPKDKPFGRVLPIEIQLHILFLAECFLTNDKRKKSTTKSDYCPSAFPSDPR